ncbi:hypothetical protein NP233_g5034 [Leucocoprinus birnbaumii]|uniref:Uncharacterized protein n=1 Tax=Leucocoprinus birnbaumii TaxID=56174 RepID=A0AAD5VWA4_9AGAR|nr:hypothetical protein NP233_g5034 [Leucocoprinus birnbaumii]
MQIGAVLLWSLLSLTIWSLSLEPDILPTVHLLACGPGSSAAHSSPYDLAVPLVGMQLRYRSAHWHTARVPLCSLASTPLLLPSLLSADMAIAMHFYMHKQCPQPSMPTMNYPESVTESNSGAPSEPESESARLPPTHPSYFPPIGKGPDHVPQAKNPHMNNSGNEPYAQVLYEAQSACAELKAFLTAYRLLCGVLDKKITPASNAAQVAVPQCLATMASSSSTHVLDTATIPFASPPASKPVHIKSKTTSSPIQKVKIKSPSPVHTFLPDKVETNKPNLALVPLTQSPSLLRLPIKCQSQSPLLMTCPAKRQKLITETWAGRQHQQVYAPNPTPAPSWNPAGQGLHPLSEDYCPSESHHGLSSRPSCYGAETFSSCSALSMAAPELPALSIETHLAWLTQVNKAILLSCPNASIQKWVAKLVKGKQQKKKAQDLKEAEPLLPPDVELLEKLAKNKALSDHWFWTQEFWLSVKPKSLGMENIEKKKGVNSTACYIVNFFGISIMQGKLRHSRGGKLPCWGHIGEEAKSEYVLLMEDKFPFLCICEDHWKSLELAQDNFSYAMLSVPTNDLDPLTSVKWPANDDTKAKEPDMRCMRVDKPDDSQVSQPALPVVNALKPLKPSSKQAQIPLPSFVSSLVASSSALDSAPSSPSLAAPQPPLALKAVSARPPPPMPNLSHLPPPPVIKPTIRPVPRPKPLGMCPLPQPPAKPPAPATVSHPPIMHSNILAHHSQNLFMTMFSLILLIHIPNHLKLEHTSSQGFDMGPQAQPLEPLSKTEDTLLGSGTSHQSHINDLGAPTPAESDPNVLLATSSTEQTQSSSPVSGEAKQVDDAVGGIPSPPVVDASTESSPESPSLPSSTSSFPNFPRKAPNEPNEYTEAICRCMKPDGSRPYRARRGCPLFRALFGQWWKTKHPGGTYEEFQRDWFGLSVEEQRPWVEKATDLYYQDHPNEHPDIYMLAAAGDTQEAV